MSKAQARYTVDTEVTADLAGDLMADDYFVNKLAERDAPLVKKLVNSFKNTIKKSATVDSESVKYLKKLVNRFEKALDNANGGVKISQIGNADDEREEKADSSQQIADSKVDDERQSIIKKAQKNYSNAEVNNDVIALITKINEGDFKQNDRVYLGIVSDAIADKIEEEVGFSVQGFKMVIEARQIEHIIKDHGENGKTDQSMKNPNDIGKMEYVLDNAESVKKAGKTQAYTYMKYGWNRTADTVLYEKIIGDESYYIVQAVPDTKAKTLYVVSAFIGKSGYKKEASQLINAKGPDATAKTGSASASTDIISEKSQKDNTFDENNSKNISDERKSVKRSYEPTEDIQITLQDVQTLRSITQDGKRKSINDFSSAEIQKAEKWARKFYKELGVKSPFFRAWYGDWRVEDKTPKNGLTILPINAATQKDAVDYVKSKVKDRTFFRGNIKNDDTGFDVNVGSQIYDDTLTYANRALSRDKDFSNYIKRVSILQKVSDIVKESVLFNTSVIESKDKNDNPNRTFMHNFYNLMRMDGTDYLIVLSVDEIESNAGAIRRAYNVNKIEISPVAVTQVYKPAGTTSDSEGNYSFTYIISDLFKIVKQYDKDFKPKSVNPLLLDENGMPKTLYHQTDADFNAFDTSIEGAGARDNEMPNGIFLKSTPLDIGLKGKKQMKVYANIRNPLVFADRGEASRYWKRSIDGYKAIIDEIDSNNVKYQKEFDEAYVSDDEAREDAVLDEWENANTDLDKKAKKLINEYLKNNKYDGIILEKDEGSFGRKVQTYIALESTQIKSATDNIGTFDSSNPDIRYSKQRSYNPMDDVDDEGNKWVEGEDGGTRILFSMPDFDNPAYEYGHIPDEEPEVIETYRAVASSSAESDIRKRLADLTKAKVYARNEAKAAFGEIIEEYFEGLNVKFKGKARAEIERMLWNAFNSADEGARMSPALDIADAIITNAVVTENYEITPELEYAYAVTGYLKTHLHNINLDHIKGEIKAKYDKDTSVYAMWARKEGERGVTADQIKDELEEVCGQ